MYKSQVLVRGAESKGRLCNDFWGRQLEYIHKAGVKHLETA